MTDREPASERAAEVHGGSVDAGRPTAQPPRRPPSLAERGPEFEPTLQMRTIDDLGFAPATPQPAALPLPQRDYLRRLEPERRGPDLPDLPWRTIGIALLGVLGILAGSLFLIRYRSGGGDDLEAGLVNPSMAQMAQATVLLQGLDPAGKVLCVGSGTFVSSDGLILTNAHVVSRDAACNFTHMGVAVTANSDEPPQLRYEAGLVALDTNLDLAVLKVTTAIDPAQPVPSSFTFFSLGDSDDLGIGDPLRVFGYPEIGGDTITLTNGTVSGFTAQAGLGERALIKTDATIAGGNSGGAAVDAEGRLVGIPTKARASENGPAVDCRSQADTNADGAIDKLDSCVPIGGFLNGLRPVNLAKALVAQARDVIPRPFSEATLSVKVDPGSIVMTQPRFSLDEKDDTPVDLVDTAVAGSNKLCLFVDWAGMPEGATWDAIWFVNSSPVAQYSLVGRSWTFGPQGTNFWACAIDKKQGLPAGLYELGFFVSGQLIFAEGIEVTGKPADVHATTWRNATPQPLCSLAINPRGAGPVGLNELPPGETIKPDDTVTIDLPDGDYLVEARDCANQPVADSGSGGGVTVDADQTTFSIELPKTEP